MESTDLLNSGAKERGVEIRKVENIEKNDVRGQDKRAPPDGGALAWSIMMGSFLTNGILFGTINSVGVVYEILKTQLEQQGDEHAASKASLVGTLTIGMTFFLSPVSGVLTDAMGIRQTAVLGGTIAAAGVFLSSFLSHNISALYFTYGIMFGLGAALAYTPSLAILGHYFDRYLGLVNGVVTAASPVFTILILTILRYLKTQYNDDLRVLFRVQAAITIGVALCGFLFKPVDFMMAETPKREGGLRAFWKTVINVEIFKKVRYVVWASALPTALFGYFVPYVFFSNFIKKEFKGYNEDIAVKCISITSCIGRLVVGYLSDKKTINRIFLQQISFYAIGILTMILPFVTHYWMVVVISLGMGIFDGGFIALLGPIAIDLCGSKCAAQAIGTLLGLASIPVSLGPPIAGAILKATGSFTLPFVLSGIPPLIGATIMSLIHLSDRKKRSRNDRGKGGNINGGVEGIQSISLADNTI